MKWAIINPWEISEKSIGGTERYVKDLANSLTALGCEVDVYMLSGTNYSNNNVNYFSLNISGEGVIVDEYELASKFGDLTLESTYNNIAKFLEDKIDVEKYDVLQLNSHIFLKCWENKNRVYTLHSNKAEFLVTGNKKEYKLMEKIMKEQAKKGMKFVVPSESYYEHWQNILKQNVISIPHAIEPSRLNCNIATEDILNKYSLSRNKVKFLLPSRLEPIQKRPMLFLQACANVKKHLKNKIQIVFTGIDSQYEKYTHALKNFAQKKNVDAQFVKFENINQGYKACEVVVMPSKMETFGYSALEGLILGKPTILSSIPTFYEISKNNQQAHIFKTKKELTKIIENLLTTNLSIILPSQEWINRFDLLLWAKKYLDIKF